MVFSLITLAILPTAGRAALLACASALRARGGIVVFDGNYRALLWPDADAARTARDAAIAVCDIGLPTIEDEAALGGGNAEAIAAHWAAAGVREVVVKLGAQGCRLADGAILPPPAVLRPIDTSGAGDAFDAGYIDARLGGRDVVDAVAAAHRLAAWTIMQAGAAPCRSEDAPYR